MQQATAILTEAIFQNTEFFRCTACNGELQSRADATRSVMMNLLHESDMEDEIDALVSRYMKYDYALVKIILERPDEVELVRAPVPIQQAKAVVDQLEAIDKPYRVLSDDENDQFVVIECPEVQQGLKIGIRSLDIRNVAFSDGKRRNIQDQPTVHEFHFYTEDELLDIPGLVNLDKRGAPNAVNKHHPDPVNQLSYTSGTNATAPNFPQWMVTESHQQIPWMRWVERSEFSGADLSAFADKFGVVMGEFSIPQKWIAVHKDGDALFHVKPTYHPRRNKHVYYGCSFVPADSELVGQGFYRQIQGVCQLINQLSNMGFDNIRQKLSMSAFVNKFSDVDADKVEQLRQNYDALVEVEMNSGRALKDDVIWLTEILPDLTQSMLAMTTYLQNRAWVQGAPAVMQGIGRSETATVGNINNTRGQQKLDAPLRRLCNRALVPALEAVRDCVFLYFDKPMFIESAGEEGAKLGKFKLVTRTDITNRFKIQPLVSYDFISRREKAQALLAGLNILRGIAPPEIMIKNYALFLEWNGVDRYTINELTDNQGKGTNPDDEILVMMLNPTEAMGDRVRMDDDHAACLQAAARGLEKYGATLWLNPNFQDYVKRHKDLMMLQLQQQMMANMAGGGAPAALGGPSTPGAPPGQLAEPGQNPAEGGPGPMPAVGPRAGVPTSGPGPLTLTRSAAQKIGPGNQGPMFRAGMTGRAVPPGIRNV